VWRGPERPRRRQGTIAIVTSDNDTVALLERALDQTAVIIGAIGSDQATLETPCPDWDVRALVRHVIGQDLRNFIVSARGETADWRAPADGLGEDWAAARLCLRGSDQVGTDAGDGD